MKRRAEALLFVYQIPVVISTNFSLYDEATNENDACSLSGGKMSLRYRADFVQKRSSIKEEMYLEFWNM
ncbi:hypothetical protein J2T19_000747 [Paenibacillus tundrae]|uniref:Uncharacterized protein n=1 Tax=Paenibacillus tundrae TaxID=528187 RepID=A0ABT9W8A7_9BACL|nr:hypothetical protein [Paenibacillus tundrae]